MFNLTEMDTYLGSGFAFMPALPQLTPLSKSSQSDMGSFLNCLRPESLLQNKRGMAVGNHSEIPGSTIYGTIQKLLALECLLRGHLRFLIRDISDIIGCHL